MKKVLMVLTISLLSTAAFADQDLSSSNSNLSTPSNEDQTFFLTRETYVEQAFRVYSHGSYYIPESREKVFAQGADMVLDFNQCESDYLNYKNDKAKLRELWPACEANTNQSMNAFLTGLIEARNESRASVVGKSVVEQIKMGKLLAGQLQIDYEFIERFQGRRELLRERFNN